ncbi:hypothetical protein BV20DRAFT_975328 [Pilatotrama ljubarskyi]|nr:hypothetical protein BV20DRAFT_975328 [Pilatotrama ljubarskyi]
MCRERQRHPATHSVTIRLAVPGIATFGIAVHLGSPESWGKLDPPEQACRAMRSNTCPHFRNNLDRSRPPGVESDPMNLAESFRL